MKKSTFWSRKVFAECLRRTWIPAVIMLLASTLFACITPIRYMTRYSYYIIYEQILSISNIIVPVNYIAIIVPIFLLSFLFSHLNSKKATDFYHALPVSRTCYFITSLSAVLMWNIVIFAIAFTASACLYMSISYFKVILSEFVLAFFACIAISLLSAGAYLTAKALSGTWFSNVILTIMLLFGPRAIICVFTQLVSDKTWLIEANNVFSLANPAYNLIYAGFTNHIMKFTVLPEYVLYTFVLAVIFLVCAYFLHIYRKSEIAESSTSNGIMRHVFAIIVTFIVSMSLIYTISHQIYDYFGTPLLIIVCVVIFWAVETVFSKSFKKGFIAMPFIGIVIALDLLFVGGVSLTSNYFINFTIDETNIKGISIFNNEDATYRYQSYAECQHLNNFVQDKEFIKAFSEEYKSTTSALKLLDGKMPGIYGPNSNTYANNYTFYIQLDNGTVVQRRMKMSDDMLKAFVKAVENTENIASMLKLPTDIDNMAFGIHFVGDNYALENKHWTREEYRSLYETFYNEYNTLSNKYKRNIISVEGQNIYPVESEVQTNIRAYIYVEGLYNHEIYQSNYAVLPSIMPKTYEKLYELAIKYSDKQLPNISENSNVSYFSIDSIGYYINSYEDFNKVVANVWEFLKNKDFKNVDLSKPTAVLSYNYFSWENDYFDTFSYVIFNITDEEKEKLNALIPDEEYTDEEYNDKQNISNTVENSQESSQSVSKTTENS